MEKQIEGNCGRFDYVKYTIISQAKQEHLKELFQLLEKRAAEYLPNGRAKDIVMQKLEEAYMWCGKGIRDVQVQCNGHAEPQEQRSNS